MATGARPPPAHRGGGRRLDHLLHPRTPRRAELPALGGVGVAQAGRRIPADLGRPARRQCLRRARTAQVVEVDTERQEGMLRSVSPHGNDEATLHYEIFLTGTKSALLRRFRAPASKIAKREQVAFAVTHEGLLLLTHRAVGAAFEQLGKALDRLQRRAQLVACAREQRGHDRVAGRGCARHRRGRLRLGFELAGFRLANGSAHGIPRSARLHLTVDASRG